MRAVLIAALCWTVTACGNADAPGNKAQASSTPSSTGTIANHRLPPSQRKAPQWNITVAPMDNATATPSQLQVASGQGAEVMFDLKPGFYLAGVSGCAGKLSGNRFVADPLKSHCQLRAQILASDGPVVITDKALADALREQLKLPVSAAIERDQLIQVTRLDLSQRGIQSLQGLEAAQRLEQLNIAGNQISDLLPLASLNRLTQLNASNNPLKDVAIIKNLPLESLTLDQTPVDNLEFLRSMPSIKELNINDTYVSNLSPLLDGSLSAGDKLFIGSSAKSCLTTQGYSLPMVHMAELKRRGVSVAFTNDYKSRSNCPEAKEPSPGKLTASTEQP
jgi:Leucine-rich repeat (LRR) protein